MKKNIYYWSPCLNPVGTTISTINSSIALSKYSNKYNVSVINTCGEWDKFKKKLSKKKVEVIDLNFRYFRILPKTGFIKSRVSYIIIFLLSFFPLIFLLKKKKPDVFIAHLITSLPILIFNIFNFNTNLILRISGFPKLNFIRRNFWRFCSSGIKIITCPSIELKYKICNLNILNKEKIFYLPDAVLNISDFRLQINTSNKFKNIFLGDKLTFLAAGRLTDQKNFSFLIDEFNEYYLENNKCRLVILGDGEEFENLNSLIFKKKLTNAVHLLGRVENVFRYMKDSDAFILSSKWEEMGFVIVEAAMNNLFVISSDCPNGPKEFLDNGKNGILFSNNKKNSLKESLKKFDKMTDEEKFKFKVQLKKNAKKFTKFSHSQILNKILSQN
tara:strand:- start:575 stop:1732 length:1158 start_codon:yes stop_codon:yes gene_type:complete